MSDEITQQTLLPEVKDPNLWMVKCRIWEEKATVLQLMRKMIAYQHEEEPLQIRSVSKPGQSLYNADTTFLFSQKRYYGSGHLLSVSRLKFNLYESD